MSKFRKKGQLFIEYIIVLPLMIISLWLILQMIVYVYANNQVDHAADDGAILVAQQLRGEVGKINALPNKNQIVDDLYVRLNQSLGNNGFILFAKDNTNNNLTLNNFNTIIEDKTSCEDAFKNNGDSRVICVFTESISTGGRNHDQIIVRVKVPFKITGNFLPNIEDKIFLYGNGVSTKEIAGRFQYYQ